MKALVSPTDSELAYALGNDALISSIPEQKGADVLIYTDPGLFGIQRKVIPGDFVSSVNDGRLSRETTLLQATCRFRLLLCEGRFRYYPDGTLVMGDKVPGKYNFARIQGMLFSVRYVKTIDIDYTDDLDGTVKYIRYVMSYFAENKHLSLYTRPSAPSDWFKPSTSEIHSWILQSFDGIGPVLADHIVKHLGRMPIKWDCTLEELYKVPRLPRKKAEEIWNTLNKTERSQEILKNFSLQHSKQEQPQETLLDKLRRLQK